MKSVAPIRRSLGVKTFFNMLGPLVNPGQPTHQLFGVFQLPLARMYQYILQEEKKSFGVVYALDGYDEVSLTGPFQLRTDHGETILQPADLNMPTYTAAELFGGDTVEEAADIFTNILSGKGTPAQRDVVAANAGLAIHIIKPEQSLNDCILEARESLDAGRAHACLKNLLNP
jgi:anthranilate phosphoribosyltransferase